MPSLILHVSLEKESSGSGWRNQETFHKRNPETPIRKENAISRNLEKVMHFTSKFHFTLLLIILASLVGKSLLSIEEGDEEEEEIRDLFGVDVVGPESYVALGSGPLTLGYRSERIGFVNRTTDFIFSIQLTFLEEEDGTESFVGTKEAFPTTQWNHVTFDCGLIVRGGIYHIRLIEISGAAESSGGGDESIYFYIQSYNGNPLESHNTIKLSVEYPPIDFEVPSLLEAYTPNVLITIGLTKSLCPPLRPLPPTELLLTRSHGDGDQEEVIKAHHIGGSLLLNDPLKTLQKEGRISLTVECQMWGRNSTYRVEIREKLRQRKLITKSGTIKVEWSWKFGMSLSKTSIVPCRRNIRVTISYPECVLRGKDKIRVYGYESLPVPALLAPRRQSYITERQIQANGTDGKTLLFSCALFPQRFSKYCFQYVNTGVDESVSIVMETCIPTLSPEKFTDGGWGSWSSWSDCSVSCGKEGKQFRYRFCDMPQPSFGGNFCQGESIEERRCGEVGVEGDEETATMPNCPPLPPPRTTTTTLSPDESPEVEYPAKNVPGWNPWIKDTRGGHFEDKNKGIPTSGCECGCILPDLVPGFNYTLVISLSSNHSACEDEDEEEHHNLRWILNTREGGDTIRFQILAAAARCVVLTFRDGNTSDSNLLQLLHAPILGRTNQITTIETTGTSLSIGAYDEPNENCTFPSMYFFGFYEVLPPPPPGGEDQFLTWKEFWTFLLLKLSLLLFIVIASVSLLSGLTACCAKKVSEYKELKWSRSDDEEEGAGMDYCNTSRTTSVTLMSFDYNYLRRLRLKHFLLHPKKIISTHVKSLPNTPNTRRKRPIVDSEGNYKGKGSTSDEAGLLKSISLSDTNLSRQRNNLKSTSHPPSKPREKTIIPRVPTPSTSDITPRIKRRIEDNTSYTGSEMNSLNDLEMDYYDYDIQNAGNIPGSYLLEPSFVFWSDPYDQISNSEDQGIELMNTSTSIGGTNSSGLFTPEPPPPNANGAAVKETSFDTLDGYHIKFADDEDDDEPTISDSVAEIESFLKS